MLGGLIMLVCTGVFSTLTYGIGKIHGYDLCDKENEAFQKGLKKHG